MAYQIIKNVSIAGITTCVPKNVEENTSLSFFKEGEAEKVILSTGIERRRIVDPGVTSGDLSCKAAEDLIVGLGWNKEDIDCLIFVSQTQDYILPATSCVIQGKLGLPNSCCCFDISYGCSGWIYGLSVISAMLSTGAMKKGLLLGAIPPQPLNQPRIKLPDRYLVMQVQPPRWNITLRLRT